MKKFKVILGLLVIILLMAIVPFVYVYNNLNVGEVPQESDVIIVPEGGGDDRARKSVELLKNGYADKIIVSPRIVTDSSDTAESYLDAGATDEQLIYEYDSTSTWTNAVNSLAIMEERGYGSALVVTSDYHTRRTRLAFERVNDKEDYGFDLTYIASDSVEDSAIRTEYSSGTKHGIAFRETLKYFGYLFGLYHLFDL